MPSMTKEDKKRLQRALKEEEEQTAYAELKRIQACQRTMEEYCPDFGPDKKWRWEFDDEPTRERGSASSAAEKTQGPIAPAPP